MDSPPTNSSVLPALFFDGDGDGVWEWENPISRRLEFEFDLESDSFSIMSVMYASELDIGELEPESPLDVVIVSHLLSKNETGCFECPICYDTNTLDKRVTISCNHNFCVSCTVSLLKTCNQERKNAKCPMCRHDCFLIETPDETQYNDLGEMLEAFRTM